MELDKERAVVVVRFFGLKYPGIEREYAFSNDAFVIRKTNGQLVTDVAAWMADGKVPL
jgi:hypothetical protein